MKESVNLSVEMSDRCSNMETGEIVEETHAKVSGRKEQGLEVCEFQKYKNDSKSGKIDDNHHRTEMEIEQKVIIESTLKNTEEHDFKD